MLTYKQLAGNDCTVPDEFVSVWISVYASCLVSRTEGIEEQEEEASPLPV